ncbi:SWIM zinc finger domain-containing protein [Streptomyces sp. WMMC500]|uniref:SWIM zinc finger family protein n=1 Tax=Streptomyces sp. WMMC500 TaxID=3015154 RepID=UPI00248CB7E6|nr:SWIM zinc finger family protein [Streptomyces sp. WMMC500]WBB64499.1 SWIM zinc finger domain-containing protein [Streptomyces sp. WMMC500]
MGMEGQSERWTVDQVWGLAPDASSRAAGGKLAAAGPWAESGAAGDAVWGLCRGSGSRPYQTVVDLQGPAYKCSCPSRKFPCKHALGLLLRWAGGDVPESPREASREKGAGEGVPEWAAEWLASRREKAERKAAGEPAAERAPDPAAAAEARRRAEQRRQRIAAGAAELEQRLTDLLRDGLATAPRGAVWEETAARMVDAQAPGLAARVRELGVLPASGPGWPARLLAECSLIHLLDQGFLRLDELPEPLAATVRTRVGLTVDAAGLLRGGTLRDDWLVLAQEDADDGKLVTRRIWLHGARSQRMALLLAYGAAGRAPEQSLPTGLALDAELAYYPGAHPLRAALGAVHAGPRTPPGGERAVPPGAGVAEVVAAYGAALAADPWLEGIPAVLTDVVPVPEEGDEGWQLAERAGDRALPLHPAAGRGPGVWQLLAVSGGGPVTVFGEFGHAGFRPLTTWSAGAAVPLTGAAAAMAGAPIAAPKGGGTWH